MGLSKNGKKKSLLSQARVFCFIFVYEKIDSMVSPMLIRLNGLASIGSSYVLQALRLCGILKLLITVSFPLYQQHGPSSLMPIAITKHIASLSFMAWQALLHPDRDILSWACI